MGSAPQPASSPMSQFANQSFSGPMAGWMAPTQALAGIAAGEPGSQIQQQLQNDAQNMSLPSGMAAPAQPQSTPVQQPSTSMPQQSQSNVAPITQQLQQAVQPGSSANTYTQQQNPLSQILGGWGNRYG